MTRENEARRLRERIEMMETDIKDVRLLIYPLDFFVCVVYCLFVNKDLPMNKKQDF